MVVVVAVVVVAVVVVAMVVVAVVVVAVFGNDERYQSYKDCANEHARHGTMLPCLLSRLPPHVRRYARRPCAAPRRLGMHAP